MQSTIWFLAVSGLLAQTGRPSAIALDPVIARPPIARVVPRTITIHDQSRVDPYFWLRDRTNPAVHAYIQAENAYTDAVMKPTAAFQQTLYEEMLSHLAQDDVDVPYHWRGAEYYSRTEAGKQYPIRCRKQSRPGAPEEVVLDLNELAEGHQFLAVHESAISDNGRWLAYTTDVTGYRNFTLHIKDLETGKTLAEQVERVRSLAWAADNQTLFYVVEDAAKRPHRLYRRRIGSAGEGQPVYEEPDERFRLFIHRSADDKYLLISSESFRASETRVLPSDLPGEAPRLLLPREEGHQYEVEHGAGKFYFRTNRGHQDFRVVSAPSDDPRPEHWTELFPFHEGTNVERIFIFAHNAVLCLRQNALPRLMVIDLETGSNHDVTFPEPAYGITPDLHQDYDSALFRFRYSSFVTPAITFDYDLAGHKLIVRKRTPVPGYNPVDYTMEWASATASDGVQIPISMVSRKNVARDGSAPMVLFGYGSYGAPTVIGFDPKRLPLLDRGVIYAQAHVRGSGDLGKRWHDQGRLLAKRNTFTDFIASAEHLIAHKYTARDRLAIRSLSSGGLLIGSALNARPDLFQAAVLRGPFLDLINTSLDESLPLTVPEYLEWGDPHVKQVYDYMKTYCPYTNIKAQAYPAMLLLTSMNDSQVMYWEPVKYVARMRAFKTDHNPLLLRVLESADHGGSSGRYNALHEEAFVQAFLLCELGAGAIEPAHSGASP